MDPLWTHSYTFIHLWTHYGPIHISVIIVCRRQKQVLHMLVCLGIACNTYNHLPRHNFDGSLIFQNILLQPFLVKMGKRGGVRQRILARQSCGADGANESSPNDSPSLASQSPARNVRRHGGWQTTHCTTGRQCF